MDLLVCPECRVFPMKLYVFDTSRHPKREFRISKCELYCAYLDKKVEEAQDTPCDECIKVEIEGGLLVCPKCTNWFPIYNGIPMMLVGDLRDKKIEKLFLSQYGDKIPDKLVHK
jgi:uncharacterized protein YbaR (Trm112 family)